MSPLLSSSSSFFHFFFPPLPGLNHARYLEGFVLKVLQHQDNRVGVPHNGLELGNVMLAAEYLQAFDFPLDALGVARLWRRKGDRDKPKRRRAGVCQPAECASGPRSGARVVRRDILP